MSLTDVEKVNPSVESEDVNHIEAIERDADQTEHEETFFQALRKYPKIDLWCCFGLWVLTLASYDSYAGGIAVGIPEFRKVFGTNFEGTWILPANWLSAFSGVPQATSVFGSLAASFFADLIGRKLIFAIAFAFVLAGITCEFVAVTPAVFLVGKLLNGFATGAFSTVTITYLGEITPLALRGVMTAAAGLSFTFGPFIVSLLVNSYGSLTTRWAYRGIFVSQYAVTAAGIILWPFMPESPLWLVSCGNVKKAEVALRRFGYTTSESQRLAARIKLTLDQTRSEAEGATFAECFQGTNLRRTIISILPLTIQAMTGIIFVLSYLTYYAQLAGFSASLSFKINVTYSVLAMVGNITSWILTDRVGRRDLTFYGLTVVTVILFIAGGLGTQSSSVPCIQGVIAMLCLYGFVYNATIGATAYNLVTEAPTSRLRAKTVSMGLALQAACYTMWTFVLPYLFNPDEANLGAKTTFLFGGISVISLVYLWFCQPETSGRSFEEIDEMFAKRIPARKFKSYQPTVDHADKEPVVSLGG